MGKQRTCFIIGPMKDSAGTSSKPRLTRLKNEVVRPVLDELTEHSNDNYKVTTPYDLGISGTSAVIRDVIHHIDRADIVIADLSDGNPNVFYELGITHALGRPCVAVMQHGQRVEFDVNAYRVFSIDLSPEADEDAYRKARETLRGPLMTAHLRAADWSVLENPVIDFFRAPITYLSPAPALADGYFTNFVAPIVDSLVRRKGRDYVYDVGLASIGSNVPQQIEETTRLTSDERDRLDLHVVIPSRIDLTKHQYADRLRGILRAALVEGDGRSFTLWTYESGGRRHLVDIPTTMRGIETAVDRRMRYGNVAHDALEWREVEEQEVFRFRTMLQVRINNHPESPSFARRVRLVIYNPDEKNEDLAWLDEALRDK
jgi:hypothetical protein